MFGSAPRAARNTSHRTQPRRSRRSDRSSDPIGPRHLACSHVAARDPQCRAHRGPSCERARCTPDIEAPSPEAERRAPMQPKTLRLGRAQHAASALRRRSDARLRELRLQRRDLRVLEPHQLLELLDLDLQNLHGLSHLGQLGVLLVEKPLIPPSIAPL